MTKILFFLLPNSVLSYMIESDTQLAETAFVEPMLRRSTYRECMIWKADRLGSMLFVRPDGFLRLVHPFIKIHRMFVCKVNFLQTEKGARL